MLDTPETEHTANSILVRIVGEFAGKGNKEGLDPPSKARKLAELIDDYFPL
jgi:hypothetical protein